MKFKWFTLYICCFLAFSKILYAQNYYKIDSLKKTLTSLPPINNSETDTLLMKNCFSIGKEFLNYSPDSALYWFAKYTDTVIDISKVKQMPRKYCLNGQAMRFIGITYFYKGDYLKTIDFWKKSLNIYSELNDKQGISNCFNNLGIVFEVQGDYPKSIDYYEKSLKISEDFKDKNGIASCYLNLGIVFINQGDYLKAIEYLERALALKEELSDKSGVAKCMINLGTVYNLKKDFPKAIDFYESSINILENIGEKMEISEGLLGLGMIYKEQDKYLKAKEYIEKALSLNEELNDKLGISYCLYHLGNLYYEQSDYINALEYFNKALKLKEEQGVYATLAEEDYPSLGSTYVKLHQYDKAAYYYLKAANKEKNIIRDNFHIMSEKEKGDFLGKTGSVYNILNDFASLTKIDCVLVQCYNNEILLKGLLLNSSSNMLKEITNSKDTNITNTYWNLKQVRNNISLLQSTPISGRTENLDSLNKVANDLERKLVILSSNFDILQKQFEYKYQDIQKNLAKDEIAIEFIRIIHFLDKPFGSKTDSIGYAALIIRPDDKYPQFISLCSEQVLLKMVGDLSWNDYDVCKLFYNKESKKGIRLYDYIWKPLEPFLQNIKNIYYSPAGILNQISFAAIPTPEKKLLSDIYNLNMVLSTHVLINKTEEKIKLEDAMIFGGIQYNGDSLFIESVAQYHRNDNSSSIDKLKKTGKSSSIDNYWNYLPGTEMEGNKINLLFEKKKIKSIYYNGYEGLEEILKKNVTSPTIIHIATHGFYFPTPDKGKEYTLFENSFIHNLNPLFRSGLLFAGANLIWSGEKPVENIEDGILTAYEVSNLNLSNTKLVVLSACETGLGEVKGNEGVYGLQRAFKMAGVRYIIMSLWPVPDAQTIELMEYFYQELLSEKTIRKAFISAQKKMKLKYEPYYWAGFVLME